MRRIVAFLLLLCSVGVASAKPKVVDSSRSKAPVWYNGAEAESIIVSVVSDTSVEDAKRRAVEQIKIKMIESIAQNINYSTLSTIEQKSGDEESFSDEFRSALLLNSAKVPFVSGISESKIEDFYWCITEDTQSKKRNYVYSIKYPLPHSQVEELVSNFERLDREKSQELEMLERGYNNIESLEEIADAIAKCGELNAYFFDASRKAVVASLTSKYNSLYGRINVVTQSEELGRAYVALQIGDRKIATSQKPMARYDTTNIQNFSIVPREGGFEVNYDPQFCETRIPYVITLSLSVGSRRLTHQITFTKSDKAAVNIQPQGVVTLTAQQIGAESLTNIQVQLDMLVDGVGHNAPIVIEVITIRVPTLLDELYINRASAKYVATNRVSVLGLNTTTIAKSSEKSGSTIKVLTGEISGYYGEERIPFQSKFTKSYKCNW